MKIRQGFVSNSSSSSFVVIDRENRIKINVPKISTINVPQTFGGETDFGRNHLDHKDFGSRLNWAFMMAYSMDMYQAQYGNCFVDEEMSNEEFFKKWPLSNFSNLVELVRLSVKETFQNETGAMYDIQVNLDLEYEDQMDHDAWWNNPSKIEVEKRVYCHIDHQSTWFQKPEQLLIFINPAFIKNFLFGKTSMICERSDDTFHANELVDGNMILPERPEVPSPDLEDDIPF
jgi:hypothetical protein